MKSNQSNVIERLQQAENAHDLEALLACFAPDCQSAQPVYPDRAFQGIEYVRRSGSLPTPQLQLSRLENRAE